MALLRFLLVCVAVAFFVQIISATPSRDKRETDTTKTTSKELEDVLNSFKDNLSKLATDIKTNEYVQNFTSMIQQFGDSVAEQGKKIVNKIQADAKN